MPEFKKGDYIIALKINGPEYNTAKVNYCVKQGKDSPYLSTENDCTLNGKPNFNTTYKFDKSHNLRDWRYATPEEIAEYNRLGHPFDVTTLSSWSSEFTEDKIISYVKKAKPDLKDLEHLLNYNLSNPTYCSIPGDSLEAKAKYILSKSEESKVESEHPLITEAKRRYPPGSKVCFAHMLKSSLRYMIIDKDCEFVVLGDAVVSQVKHIGDSYINSPESHSGSNGYGYTRNVYYEGKWSELYEENKIEDITKPYQHLVGREYPADLLSEWASSSNNSYNGTEWENYKGSYVGKRTIQSIRDINGIPAIRLSGTTGDVAIKATLFEDFVKNWFIKSVPKPPLPPKDSPKKNKPTKLSTMTNVEELVETARKLYPIGTEHKYLDADGTHPPFMGTVKTERQANRIGDTIEAGSGYIYANGVWAEIITEESKQSTQFGEEDEDYQADERYSPEMGPPASKASKPTLILHREEKVQKLEIKLSNNKLKNKKKR